MKVEVKRILTQSDVFENKYFLAISPGIHEIKVCHRFLHRDYDRYQSILFLDSNQAISPLDFREFLRKGYIEIICE